MLVSRRHWIMAVVMAVTIHVGFAATVFWKPGDVSPRAPSIGGVEVALGPTNTVAESTSDDTAAETPQAEANDPTLSEQKTNPPLPERKDSVRETPAPPEPLTAKIPEPIETPVDVTPVDVTPLEPLFPERAPETAMIPSHPPAPTAEPQDTSQVVAGIEAQNTPLSSNNAGHNAEPENTRGMAGTETSYAATLLAWLERHKQYPRQARQRRQQGTTLLYIVMSRNGYVIKARIEESSGYGLLDQAALSMLERAQPLPPIPDSMNTARLELIVPVQFFMN